MAEAEPVGVPEAHAVLVDESNESPFHFARSVKMGSVNSAMRIMEIYENERSAPLYGWSASSLLPTDRGAYSTKDGLLSFKTLNDADKELLSAGWQWENGSEWTVRLDGACDNKGYQYAFNFGSIDEGTGTMSMNHFVRRRRMERKKVFVPASICNQEMASCDHCDLEMVEKLSSKLLVTLTKSSLVSYPTSINWPKMNSLKTALIEALKLRYQAQGIDGVMKVLDSFAQGSSSAWSVMSGMVSGKPEDNLAKRTADLAGEYFPSDERGLLAKTIIRWHDDDCMYHCPSKNCGKRCVLHVVGDRDACWVNG